MPECFDHEGARGLEQPARRAVAAHHDLPAAQARPPARDRRRSGCASSCAPSYVKVAEYQRRGLVHLHVVIRLDRAMPDYRARRAQAARRGASPSSCSSTRSAPPSPTCARRSRTSSAAGTCAGAPSSTSAALDAHERREVAGYLAKYATKSTEQAGGVLHRVTEAAVDQLPVREHVRAFLRAAFELHGRSRARRPAVRGVRARARLPRALPDQEPPLLDHLQGAAPGARATRARAAPRPLNDAAQRAIAAAPRRARRASATPGRGISQPPTRSSPLRRPPGHVSTGESAREERCERLGVGLEGDWDRRPGAPARTSGREGRKWWVRCGSRSRRWRR